MTAVPRTQRALLVAAASVLAVTGIVACFIVRSRPPATPPPAAVNSPGGGGGAAIAVGAGISDAGVVVYDPTKLLDNGVPAAEVYDKEPRADFWGEVVEANVAAAIAGDFAATLPEAKVGVKCKTLSCLVAIVAPPDKRATALAISKVIALAPWVVDLAPEADGTQHWLFFEEPRFTDPAAFVTWFKTARKNTLAAIRAAKVPNPFPVAPDKVPQE